MQLPILCPSKGRASDVLTKKYFPEMIIIVPSGEGDLYRDHNPDQEVMETPKGIRGITMTRQWCLDKWDEVFFVDDDVKSIVKNFTAKQEEASPGEISEVIKRDCFIAREIGAKMFGYRSIRNPVEFKGNMLFNSTGYINFSHVGILKDHGLKFDLTLSEAEDYYLTALNIYLNRYSVISHAYSFHTDNNFHKTGGCSDYRTERVMMQNTKKLIDYFGNNVVRYKNKSGGKKSIIRGERSVTFPI